jgi:hypothetical protein
MPHVEQELHTYLCFSGVRIAQYLIFFMTLRVAQYPVLYLVFCRPLLGFCLVLFILAISLSLLLRFNRLLITTFGILKLFLNKIMTICINKS